MPNHAKGYSRKKRWCPAAHAAGAVRADHEVGDQLVPGAVGVDVPDPGAVGVHVEDLDAGDAEAHVAAVAHAGAVQVGEDLGLGVEPHRGADEVLEVEVVAAAVEAQVDAAVTVAVGEHPLLAGSVDAGVGEQPDAVGLEDARAVRRLDLVDGAVVHDHALDAAAGQEVAEHQPGRPSTDDGDLGASAALGVHERNGRNGRRDDVRLAFC
jgi:hypothetical protein